MILKEKKLFLVTSKLKLPNKVFPKEILQGIKENTLRKAITKQFYYPHNAVKFEDYFLIEKS